VKKVRERSNLPGSKLKVLVDITNTSIVPRASSYRRGIAEGIKNLYHKDPEFQRIQKVAVFGGSLIIRTITSFVIMAAKLQKRMKIFETKEEALNWLMKN